MITIIGDSVRARLLCGAAQQAGVEAEVLAALDEIRDPCELIILDTTENLDSRQTEIAKLQQLSSAPIAVTISTNYACAMAKDAPDQSRIVAIRTMENDQIGQYIELTKTADTDPAVYDAVYTLLQSFHTHVAKVPDVMGGIFYRISFLYSNMGAYLVSEGVSIEDVDLAIRYGNNIKRPPLQLADEIGLDRVLDILTALYRETGRPAYRPSPLIKQLVSAGRLGKKSGRGFYTYR